MQRLKEAGLKIKPSKCQLYCERASVLYLGHVVSEKGVVHVELVEVHVDPRKTSCVRSWQVRNDRDSLVCGNFWALPIVNESLFPVLQIASNGESNLHSLTEKAKAMPQWSQQCKEAFAVEGEITLPMHATYLVFSTV